MPRVGGALSARCRQYQATAGSLSNIEDGAVTARATHRAIGPFLGVIGVFRISVLRDVLSYQTPGSRRFVLAM